jgi:hypothetical protein
LRRGFLPYTLRRAESKPRRPSESIRAQIDTVNLAKKYLLVHPEACKLTGRPTVGQPVKLRGTEGGNAEKQHEHGSEATMVALLR